MPMASLILLLVIQAIEPEQVFLTGIITGADGKPAVGAEVVLAEGLPPLSDLIRRAGTVLRPPAVLRRMQVDANGGFQIEMPPDDVTVQRFRRPIFLWALGPGGSLALRPISDNWPPDGEPVRLTLAASEPVRFRALDPDGRPVAGARVVPARLRGVDVPAELGARFEVQTDGAGWGTLAVSAASELDVIRVISGSFGVQQLRVTKSDTDGVRTLRLLPVGRVVGQIQADDSQAVRGLTVRLRTDPDPSADVVGVGGSASVVTDDQGRFAVPAIAAGKLAMSVDYPWNLPWRGPLVGSWPQVQCNSTTAVTIPLMRAPRITGVVRENLSGRPIAGVGVAVAMDAAIPLVTSDNEGRFSAYVAPGMAYSFAVRIPRGYYSPTDRVNSESILEGVKELTLKPIFLSAALEVQGMVIDAEGIPVPAADVSGEYDIPQGFGRFIHALTDRQGRFRIVNVPPGTPLRLSARRGHATTAEPEPISPGKELVTLKISPDHAVAISGRINEQSGRPVAGAIVRVSARKRGRQDIPIEEFKVSFDDDGHTMLRTDTKGQFNTPRRLRPDMEYRVDVEAEGYVAAGTEWIKPDQLRSRHFVAVVLQPIAPTRTLVGRVVDIRHHPVAGAVVFQSGDGPARTRSVTDTDGRFRLVSVYREPAFLFVEGHGLRFEGHRIGPQLEEIELLAQSVGAPLGLPFHTLPPVLPRDEEKALALRVIEADLAALATRKDIPNKTLQWTRILARFALDRALNLVDDKSRLDQNYGNHLRLECARALIGESADEAFAVGEALADPVFRCRFFREASDAVPKSDRAHKLSLLEKALVQARAVRDAAHKLDELGMIGYRLLDMSENARGTEVLREGQRIADTLPKLVAGQRIPQTVHARGRFAAKLARIDAKAAFGLTEGFASPYSELYNGGIALGLADRDPAESERALGMLKTARLRDPRVIRAVGRMAAIDRVRARRLAEALASPIDQAVALGSMARGLANSDPKAGAALIDEAFDRLIKLMDGGGYEHSADPCLAAAEMLPTAEQLDAELLHRSFWKTVSLRPLRSDGSDASFPYEQAASSLALMLARYDRAVARQVLEPAARQVRSLDYGRRSWARNLFVAATLIDPAWAVSLADSLPDDKPGADLHPKASMRLVIADVLAHSGPDRWEQLDRDQVGHNLPSRSRDSKDDER
jgi:hypothetical protein